ncbi:hypothetical protein Ae201684P_013740 [Aphanomyces euteiches]|nr:hypothetical protein Ae201684P_013740 [Aphanomyces euteiches]
MGAICQGCDGCDGDTRWLKKAIGFKEDKIQGVQGVQEQEPAGANSERSNLRPFVSVGTQGLTRLSARGLIRLAFEKKASKAFKEEKREDLFQVDSAFVGSPMRRLKCRKKLAVGCDEGGIPPIAPRPVGSERASERILRPVAHFGVDDSSSARPRRWELATPGQPSAVHSTNFLVFFPAFFKEVGENLEVDAKNLADFVRSAAQFLIS